MSFRLLTYNIHKGLGGLDRRYDLSRIVDVINHYAPDFALLQEVDDGVPRSRQDRQVDLLAEATGLAHQAFQRNVRLKVGHYGNALLSRYPLHDKADVELTIRLKKRRRGLAATCHLSVGGRQRSVILINIHLGLAGFERQIQLRRLLDDACVERHRDRTPLIIAGDYNDVWSSLGRQVMLPNGFRLAGPQTRTFPAAMPLRNLDRVFYRGDLMAVHAFAGHTDLARQASDHLPLIVDFEFT